MHSITSKVIYFQRPSSSTFCIQTHPKLFQYSFRLHGNLAAQFQIFEPMDHVLNFFDQIFYFFTMWNFKCMSCILCLNTFKLNINTLLRQHCKKVLQKIYKISLASQKDVDQKIYNCILDLCFIIDDGHHIISFINGNSIMLIIFVCDV